MQKLLSKLKTFLTARWKLLLAAGLLVLVAVWFLNARQSKQPQLTFIQPSREKIISSVTISGRIDAAQKARLRFIAGGKVVYVGAKEGDSVKKWQSLATIDRSTLEKQLDQDLNLYMKERYDFENTQDDIKDRTLGTTETRSVAQEQYDLENQVLNVEIQSIAIANTTLSAPFDGILTVSPTAVAGVQLLSTDYFEVVNPQTLVFKATIDEIDMRRIAVGQSAQIILDAYEDETLESYISYIAYTSSESSSGTVFLIELPIDSQDINKYRLGMNGDVLIKTAEKDNVLTIPLDCISEHDGKVFVDVKADNAEQKEEREIEIGLESEDRVEVISGLTETDQVVLPE